MRPTIWTRMQDAIQCWIGIHHIPPKAAVTEMGAVFLGGMCTRCYKVKVGQFLCNIWDDSKTEELDGVSRLQGVNPLITNGNYFVMDLEGLLEISESRRRKKNQKNSESESLDEME